MKRSTGGYTPPSPSLASRQVAQASKGHFTGHVIVHDGDQKRILEVESHLEMLWAVFLLSLPQVATIIEQAPFDWVDCEGQIRTKYFDFLVILRNGLRLACEVKPSVRLKSGRVLRELRQIAAQIDLAAADKERPAFADEVRLLTEEGLDPISIYNAEMFMGMRDPDPVADEAALLAVRELRGSATMAQLTMLIGQGARGFRALVRLIMKQVLRLDGHSRITPETRVSLQEDI
jgi:hypothetical protein